MTSSHLLRSPCDKWVYLFQYDFSGIIGGYGICVHILYGHRDFLYGHLATDREMTYGGCAEIVRKSCYAGEVAVQSPQIPHENRTALVRA